MTDISSGDTREDISNKLTKSNVTMKRFLDSMEMNYEKWHDGIGHDLAALDEMAPAERDRIVEMLINRQTNSWHDFEALEHIHTPRAISAINTALKHPSLQVRIAAARYAKGSDAEREAVLIEALEKSDFYEGLTQALDQVAEFHPQGIIDPLLRGLLKRDSVAVNFAGMLFHIYGRADSPFDWNQRPFFLRFHTTDPKERETAFPEVCSIIGVDPGKYLK